jgi:SAM-dependent methyltransferase
MLLDVIPSKARNLALSEINEIREEKVRGHDSRPSFEFRFSIFAFPAQQRQVSTLPASTAFDALAETYDETFTNSRIGRTQRDAVWRELDRVFRPGQEVLEINCGTGADAVYLAARGVQVLACDSSPRMIEVARRRLANPGSALRAPVDFEVLATEEIGTLQALGSPPQFDGALSNFAGLNCVEDLSQVARDLARLLRPGAPAVLCFFGPLCAWEILWYLAHGNPRKAFRRLRSGGDLASLAEGASVRVRYPGVRALARIFAPWFVLKRWKGVGAAVPPTYLEPLAQRFPKVLRSLEGVDRWLGRCALARGMADHILLEFERKN